MKTKNYLRAATLAPLLVLPALGLAQGGINVSVNGAAVGFRGQGPVQEAGTVLVPLRGVFEQLGAQVFYDSGQKAILATKGATTVNLRLGEARALVNGTERTLSVAAQATGGTTLVPLRFVSEALGAQVKWEAATRTVRITTDAVVADQLPPPSGTGSVTGTITGIYPETSSITVRVAGGQNTRVPLAGDAVVLIRPAQGPATEANLAALRVGDQITVRRDPSGRGTVLETSFGERRGEVKSIAQLSSGNFAITLSDGSLVEVVPNAPVTMANRAVTLADVRPGEQVAIRINPQTKLGIGVAVVTADNPEAAPPARVEVQSFTHNAQGPLKGGDTLTVTLRGTPGASATFSIPGIEQAQNVAMRETAPGTYAGTFPIPSGVNIKGASVVAQLAMGRATSPVTQAGTPLTVDATGPTLANLSPEESATLPPGKPLVYGTYSDAGTGVDPKATRLLVNNQDVTKEATTTVTEAFFSYRPAADLPAGKNSAVVVVQDGAGNQTRKEWSFTVGPAAESPIKSLTFTPSGKTLAPGQTITVRLAAAPGGQARFSVGGAAQDRPMREDLPGSYVGSYTIRKGDSLTKAPVTVAFTPSGSQMAVTQTASQSVTIAAGAPDTPIVDSPQEGAAVGGAVAVTGRAAPNATVRVSVAYQGRLVIIPARGTVADVEAKADAQGRWTTPEVKLSAPPGVSGLTYTLRAVTVDAEGAESDPATVRFRR